MNLAVAADRANLSLQALKRAKAALEIANVDAEEFATYAENAKSGDGTGRSNHSQSQLKDLG